MSKPKKKVVSATPPEVDQAVRNMFALMPDDVKRILKGPGKKKP